MLAQLKTQPDSTASRPMLPYVGHPRLSAKSPDGDLLAALRRDPGLLHNLATEAHHAATKLLQNPHWPVAELQVSAYWIQVQSLFRRAIPPLQIGVAQDQAALDASGINALRMILDARDALCGLLGDLSQLQHGELLALRGQFPPEANASMVAAAGARLPGLAAWNDRRLADASAAQSMQDEMGARERERQDAAAQAAQGTAAKSLYRRLASDGVTLTAGAKGAIAARPASLMADDDRAAITQLKVHLLALIVEPAEQIA